MKQKFWRHPIETICHIILGHKTPRITCTNGSIHDDNAGNRIYYERYNGRYKVIISDNWVDAASEMVHSDNFPKYIARWIEKEYKLAGHISYFEVKPNFWHKPLKTICLKFLKYKTPCLDYSQSCCIKDCLSRSRIEYRIVPGNLFDIIYYGDAKDKTYEQTFNSYGEGFIAKYEKGFLGRVYNQSFDSVAKLVAQWVEQQYNK